MDITSIVIGLFSLALFIVPMIYIHKKQKKGTAKLLKDFLNLAEQQHLKISQHELWNDRYAIGIDTDKGILFCLKKRAEGEAMHQIHLSEVATCRVNNVNREANGNRVVDLIELRFTFREPKLSEQAVEFYSREESMSLNEELLLTEKWKNIVSALLQSPQPQRDNTAYRGGSAALEQPFA